MDPEKACRRRPRGLGDLAEFLVAYFDNYHLPLGALLSLRLVVPHHLVFSRSDDRFDLEDLGEGRRETADPRTWVEGLQAGPLLLT